MCDTRKGVKVKAHERPKMKSFFQLNTQIGLTKEGAKKLKDDTRANAQRTAARKGRLF